MAFTKARVRIAFDLASHTAAVDVMTSSQPAIWKGNDVQFEIAAFYDGVLADMSSVTSITLEIKPSPTITDAALFTGTVSGAGATITQENWDNRTAQQFLIPMTAAQNNIDLQGNFNRTCWLVARVTCGTTYFTLGTATITVIEDGH